MRDARLKQAALVASLVVLPAATMSADLSMPNTIDLPSAADPAANWDVIYNGTERERQHVTAATKAKVLAAYNIPRT